MPIWNKVKAFGNDHGSTLKDAANSGESEISSPTLYQMGMPMAMHAMYRKARVRSANK